MSRLTTKNKEHIGLSPYALVFRGQKKTEKILLRVFNMDQDHVTESEVKTPEELISIRKSETLSWLNVDGLDNELFMEALGKTFELENNILSDVMNPSIRPKVEEFANGIFATIKMMQYNEKTEILDVENLSLIITENSLISFQEIKGDVFDSIRERIRKHKNKIRISGSDYLAFALLDVVVDNYIYVIGLLGDKIETLEEDMGKYPGQEFLDKNNAYKCELNFLRKHIKPAKEMIINLAKMDSEFIHDENKKHFKELLENINEASELSDTYREILYDQQNIYHSMISTKLNEIMRILTVISVVFIPLTFLVGVYGTNFKYIPELDLKYGYFGMWGLMIIITLLMLWYFRRKKWF
jgi:magnesium transporter